jgi:TatD DNase family protein
MQLIDTHVHLNFDVFQPDLEEIAQRWRTAGVVGLLHSCVEPQEFAAIRAIADRFPEINFAVGLHPLDADKWTNSSAAQIRELAQADSRVKAIGETGLDYYKAEDSSLQKEAFIAQLEIAHELNKAVIIHCRDAASALREICQDFWQNRGAVAGVMHCWSGNAQETQWFLDLGFYISFSGIVTFKNAREVQEAAKIVPSDRLLIETDCPFLAPNPKRGKRNEPAYVRHVAEQLAQIRHTPLETLAQQTTDNAKELFHLDLPPSQR